MGFVWFQGDLRSDDDLEKVFAAKRWVVIPMDPIQQTARLELRLF
jgi:hypothetical protein